MNVKSGMRYDDPCVDYVAGYSYRDQALDGPRPKVGNPDWLEGWRDRMAEVMNDESDDDNNSAQIFRERKARGEYMSGWKYITSYAATEGRSAAWVQGYEDGLKRLIRRGG